MFYPHPYVWIVMPQARTKRVQYQSNAAQYKLDPTKVFEVVADLLRYVSDESTSFIRGNPGFGVPTVQIRYEARRLIVTADTIGDLTEHLDCRIVDLATLVLSEDGKDLTFEVHSHESVVVNPEGLKHIVESYIID